MRILDRFIGLELIWPFFFGVAAFTSIMFGTLQLLQVTKLFLQGSPAVAIELIALSLPPVMVYTLPMSALLAVLVGFSRLSSESEIVALYASGVSLYRAMIPVVVLGIIVSGFGFMMSEVIVPNAKKLSNELMARAIKEQISTKKPFWIIDKDTNSTIYIRAGYDAKTKTMRDVTITRYNGDVPTDLYTARKAKWEGGYNWTLTNGTWYQLRHGGNTVSVTYSGVQTFPVRIGQTAEDVERNKLGADEMPYRELRKQIAKLKDAGAPPKDLLGFETDLYNKLAIPFAALVFVLIGAPLAIRPVRTGASVGLGLSILIIFGYWFLWHFTTALSSQGNLSPVMGAFTADVLGIILGIFLLVRASK